MVILSTSSASTPARIAYRAAQFSATGTYPWLKKDIRQRCIYWTCIRIKQTRWIQASPLRLRRSRKCPDNRKLTWLRRHLAASVVKAPYSISRIAFRSLHQQMMMPLKNRPRPLVWAWISLNSNKPLLKLNNKKKTQLINQINPLVKHHLPTRLTKKF